jgi:hypothetical protein
MNCGSVGDEASGRRKNDFQRVVAWNDGDVVEFRLTFEAERSVSRYRGEMAAVRQF